jgi:hypothetical protein
VCVCVCVSRRASRLPILHSAGIFRPQYEGFFPALCRCRRRETCCTAPASRAWAARAGRRPTPARSRWSRKTTWPARNPRALQTTPAPPPTPSAPTRPPTARGTRRSPRWGCCIHHLARRLCCVRAAAGDNMPVMPLQPAHSPRPSPTLLTITR